MSKNRDNQQNVEWEDVNKEMLDSIMDDAEKESLDKYGSYLEERGSVLEKDDAVRKKKKKENAKDGFHDTVTFQNQMFHVDETHGEKNIVGKFCILMQPPDGKYQMMMFSFRTDPKRIKRPVIFDTPKDAMYFLRINFANPEYARVAELSSDLYRQNDFQTTGSFLMRSSEIILPNDLHKKALDQGIQ